MPTATATLPDSVAPGLATAITATGFRWHVEDALPRTALNGEHLQHRSGAQLHRPTVKRYAIQWRAGSRPPHIGVTRDGMVIWGYHRTESAKEADRDDIPAIVFDVDGADAGTDEFLRNSLLSLAVAENAPHGLPYNPSDRQEAAKALLALGYTNGAVTMELGLSPSQVSGIKLEMDAAKRIDLVGASVTPDDLNRTVLRALAAPDARALDNEPFKRLVELAASADLTPQEVRDLAREARSPGSEIQAIEAIDDLRDSLVQRISEVASGGTVRPTPVGKLRGACKVVTDLCASASTLLIYRDHTDQVDDTKTMVQAAIDCLTNILAVQEEAEGA